MRDPEDWALYGTRVPENPKSNKDFVSYQIPYEKQILEHLQPTKKGVALLNKIVGPKERLIAIFPRHRVARRPDKNWSKEKYEVLIKRLQLKFPLFKIAIFGEPGGAYFTDGVPKGCVDLINIKPEYRMDVQLAGLKQSVLAVGGESGGIVFALAGGCRALCWGHVTYAKEFKRQNFMKTKQVFYSYTNPSVEIVMRYISWALGKGKRPYFEQMKSSFLVNSYFFIPGKIRKSKRLAKFKDSLMK